MKKLGVLVATLLVVLFSANVSAASSKDVSPYALGERSKFSDRAISERIAPSGNLCVEGEECADPSKASADVAAGPKSPEDIYNQACAGCHNNGVAGAPKLVAAEWSVRKAKGTEKLISNAINGINMMPAMGTCGDCSEEDIANTVAYMLDQAK